MSSIDFSEPKLKEKVDLLKEKLGIKPEEEITQEVVKAREEAEKEETEIKGKDVNWSDYDLDARFAHMYPKATYYKELDEWVVDITEFKSTSRLFSSSGVDKRGDPQSIGDYLTMHVNGPEEWKPYLLLPNGTASVGVILFRKTTINLPKPQLSAERDEQLSLLKEEGKEIEVASDAWMKESGIEGADWEGNNGLTEGNDSSSESESVP